ncbi:MAG: NAD(P)-dependent oxidoreductase [Thaumarchaeota archaeon]|nr:NAD(P)-dependent oxidoreductase [Nitrososphaerota archaeon]
MVLLVTGGCGYVGSFIAREAPKHHGFEGETVRIMDNFSARNWPSVPTMPEDSKYELVIGDICNPEDVRRALKDVEVVFHFGGPVGALSTPEGALLARKVIAEGTSKLLDQCIDAGVECFINTSTGGVYGKIVDSVATESSQCFPSSPYSECKLEAERYCSRRASETGMHITSLRLSTVSGYNVVMRMENLLHAFSLLASIGEPLPIWNEALGKQRPFIDIRDVAQAYLFCARTPSCKGEMFNVCNYNETAEDVVAYLQTLIPDAKEVIVDHAVYSQHNFNYPADGSKLASRGFSYRYKMPDTVATLLPHYETYYRTRKFRA